MRKLHIKRYYEKQTQAAYQKVLRETNELWDGEGGVPADKTHSFLCQL